MSKSQSTFRKTDLRRAFEGAKMAGVKLARVEIDKAGKIILVPTDSNIPEPANANEWDGAE